LLEKEIANKTILHFSPSKSLKEIIESSNIYKYVSTDYNAEFAANKQLNIEALNEPDNQFDIIICYHILEHIDNDIKAMSELYRVLKPDGLCIIQTPLKEGDIYENSSIKTKAERRIHFGQEDHLRIYSLKGLMNRLEKVGFVPKQKIFRESLNNRFGFIPKDIVVIAEKPAN